MFTQFGKERLAKHRPLVEDAEEDEEEEEERSEDETELHSGQVSSSNDQVSYFILS